MVDIVLKRIPKSDPDLKVWMANHYSAPKGFVGRQLIYKIFVNDVCYGATAAGSATKNLPGREEFFGRKIVGPELNNLVNNTFFHIEKQNGQYPCKNFSTKIVKKWREVVIIDWPLYYKSPVDGFETLVEIDGRSDGVPRTGELYRRDGWSEIGTTKGITCKRVNGKQEYSTDPSSSYVLGTRYSGYRVWETDPSKLRPKLVFARKIEEVENKADRSFRSLLSFSQ